MNQWPTNVDTLHKAHCLPNASEERTQEFGVGRKGSFFN